MKTITDSVKKTGRLVVVHEAYRNSGWGAEIAAQVTEEAFPYLDAAPLRLGAKPCPLPFNLELENAVVPSIDEIIEAAQKVCYR
jgi:pyruvate/2-oxoglutarate/acetoin dehydrogenase E1 component